MKKTFATLLAAATIAVAVAGSATDASAHIDGAAAVPLRRGLLPALSAA